MQKNDVQKENQKIIDEQIKEINKKLDKITGDKNE